MNENKFSRFGDSGFNGFVEFVRYLTNNFQNMLKMTIEKTESILYNSLQVMAKKHY